MTVPANRMQVAADLDQLAGRIMGAQLAIERAAGEIIQHAMTAGDALLAAQAQVPDGEWEQWLRSKCQLSRRSAYDYMRLARHRPKIEEHLCSIAAHLSLRGALRLIAPPRASEDPKPAPVVITADLCGTGLTVKDGKLVDQATGQLAGDDDIGPDSVGEIARKEARAEEIKANRRREIANRTDADERCRLRYRIKVRALIDEFGSAMEDFIVVALVGHASRIHHRPERRDDEEDRELAEAVLAKYDDDESPSEDEIEDADASPTTSDTDDGIPEFLKRENAAS